MNCGEGFYAGRRWCPHQGLGQAMWALEKSLLAVRLPVSLNLLPVFSPMCPLVLDVELKVGKPQRNSLQGRTIIHVVS